MVVPSIKAASGTIRNIFDDFGDISNLRLNIPKTVLIPLWGPGQKNRQEFIQEVAPVWQGCDVKTCSRYRGFVEGPGRGNTSWHKTVPKFEERALTHVAILSLGHVPLVTHIQYFCRFHSFFLVAVGRYPFTCV